MIRIIGSVLVALLLVPTLFWLGGYDFDQRGPQAVFCVLATAFVFVASLTCPIWNLLEHK